MRGNPHRHKEKIQTPSRQCSGWDSNLGPKYCQAEALTTVLHCKVSSLFAFSKTTPICRYKPWKIMTQECWVLLSADPSPSSYIVLGLPAKLSWSGSDPRPNFKILSSDTAYTVNTHERDLFITTYSLPKRCCCKCWVDYRCWYTTLAYT